VDAWLRRKFEGRIRDVEMVDKEDLDLVSGTCGRGISGCPDLVAAVVI